MRCITDRSSCFTSKDFAVFLSERNITHVNVAVHLPQANGQVERMNRTLTGMLVNHADWVKQLGKIEFAFNNTVNRSIGTTPSKALFGVGQRGEIVDRLAEYFSGRERNLENLRERAAVNIRKLQEYNKGRKMCAKGDSFRIGDYVVIRNVDATVGINKNCSQSTKVLMLFTRFCLTIGTLFVI